MKRILRSESDELARGILLLVSPQGTKDMKCEIIL